MTSLQLKDLVLTNFPRNVCSANTLLGSLPGLWKELEPMRGTVSCQQLNKPTCASDEAVIPKKEFSLQPKMSTAPPVRKLELEGGNPKKEAGILFLGHH